VFRKCPAARPSIGDFPIPFGGVAEQRIRNSVAAISSYCVLYQQILNCLENLVQASDLVLIHAGPCYRVG
jgi:hypothetical protein